MISTTMRWAVFSAVVVSLSTVVRPGHTAPIVYFDRDNSIFGGMPNSQAKFNQFTSVLGVYGIETVEGIDTVNPPFGFDPTLVFGPTGITGTTLQTTSAATAPFAGFSIGMKMLVENDALALFDPQAPQLPQADTVFRFNQLITAFGLHFIQGGDEGIPPNPSSNNNPIIVRLTNTFAGTSAFVPIQFGPGWGFNNVAFLGVTDTAPFNQVSIIETTDLTDGMTYDNLVAGFVIPEPCSFALVAFACAFGPRRHFRRG
jgi:hypothetical protein